MKNILWFIIFLQNLLVLDTAMSAITLQNDQSSWEFSDNGCLVAFRLASPQTSVITVKEPTISPWRLVLRNDNGEYIILTTDNSKEKPTINQQKNILTFTWHKISSDIIPVNLSLTETIQLNNDGSISWTAELTGTSNALFWELEYPIVSPFPTSEATRLALPIQSGVVLEAAHDTNIRLEYPSEASMQFLAAWTSQSPIPTPWVPTQHESIGLLLYAKDAAFNLKRLLANAHGNSLQLCHSYLPAYASSARTSFPQTIDFTTPYPVVTTIFKGGCLDAASIYRQWIRPLVTPKASPQWLKDATIWMDNKLEPTHVIAEWSTAQRFFNLPAISLYHNYTIARHDESSPDCLPTDAYFIPAILGSKYLKITPAPCISSRIWNPHSKTLSSHIQNLDNLCVQDENGFSIYRNDNQNHAVICPFSSSWQQAFVNNVTKLTVDRFVPAVFIENLLEPLKCYNSSHQHDIHGGNQLLNAVLNTLDMARNASSQANMESAFIMEGVSEAFIGHVDAFVFPTPQISSAKMQSAPLFDAVFHGIVHTSGSTAHLANQEPDDFAKNFASAIALGNRPYFRGITKEMLNNKDQRAILAYQTTCLYNRFQSIIDSLPQRFELSIRPLSSELHPAIIDLQVKDSEYPTIQAFAYANEQTILVFIINLTDKLQQLTFNASLQSFIKNVSYSSYLYTTNANRQPFTLPYDFQLAANDAAVIILSSDNEPINLKTSLSSLDTHVLFSQESSSFPFINSSKKSDLWACDDAIIIRNDKGQNGMINVNNTFKAISIRKGPQILVSNSQKADGLPLPRTREEQPFAVLHQLPFYLENAPGVFTIMGDQHYVLLNGNIPCGAQFYGPENGIFVSRIQTEEDKLEGNFFFFNNLKDLNDMMANPKTKKIISLAYAALDDNTLQQAVEYSNKGNIKSDALQRAWQKLKISPNLQNLANLNHETRNWFLNANLHQSLFAPGAPGEQLLKQTQALVKAAAVQVNCMNAPWLAPDDDCLVPNLPKEILTVFASPNPSELLNRTTIVPLGIKNQNDILIQPVIDSNSDSFPGFILTLNNTSLDQAILTISAWTTFQQDNIELQAMDLTWLEINKPAKFISQAKMFYATPKCKTSIPINILNLTQLKPEYKLLPQLPSDWHVVCEPQIVQLSPIEFERSTIYLTPPIHVPEGIVRIPINAQMFDFQQNLIKDFIDLEIIHSIHPLNQNTNKHLEIQPKLSSRSLSAIFVKNNERFNLNINNISNKKISWNLMNADLEIVRHDTVEPSNQQKINVTAVRDATYFLETLTTSNEPILLSSATHAIALRASQATPLFIDASEFQKFFFVPNGAKSFAICSKNLPPATSCMLISPTNRTISFVPNGKTLIQPMQDEIGKTWSIKIQHTKSGCIWLTGDAVPWLSSAPENTLIYD